MPKKFKEVNSKAAEARSRKETARLAEKDRVEKEKEDELWKDDDKHAMRKSQRKEQKESKRLEQLERKKELQSMHDEELASIKGAKSVDPSTKVTRAQIVDQEERRQAEAAKVKPAPVHDELPLVENLNRLDVDGDEARTVDEAISVMKSSEPAVEKHPEKRVKAAYAEFEERRLPVLKAENSNMRLSQIKQILKKEWQKSPDNPLNQRTSSYNIKA